MNRLEAQAAPKVVFLCGVMGALLVMTSHALLGQSQPVVWIQSSDGGSVPANGGRPAQFVIILGSASSQTVSVQYATVDGTATAGTDYQATSGTATFAPGQTSYNFTVPIIDDGSYDSVDENFNVQLSNPINCTIDPNRGSVTETIIEPPPSGPTVTFEYRSWTVSESNGTATISVLLRGPTPSGPVTVNYATTDGTAKAPTDYLPSAGPLVWQPSETGTVKTFTVAIIDNFTVGPTKTVNLTLSSPTNATLGSPATAVLNIMDDDMPCSVP